MFDIVSMLVCSIATFLFPVFASYKALKANDPAQLTPWLMYWVVIGCISFVESWVGWFLVWIPFYHLARACFMIWLVLPQTMGAAKLYREYIHPQLLQHETEIEAFIARAHQQAKSALVQNIQRLINYAKAMIFGPESVAARRPPTPVPQAPESFAQSLFARWRVPPITASAPQMATDFYNLLSTALQGEESSSSAGASRGSTLIPDHIQTPEEKRTFIEQQFARMRMVMSALEAERANLGGLDATSAAGAVDAASEVAEGWRRSASQGNLSSISGEFEQFEHVEGEEMAVDDADSDRRPQPAARGSSWLFGGWNAGEDRGQGKPHEE